MNSYNITNMGVIIGFVKVASSGDKIIYDRQGRTKGFYNKTVNATFNDKGSRVGEGDLLTMCLNN